MMWPFNHWSNTEKKSEKKCGCGFNKSSLHQPVQTVDDFNRTRSVHWEVGSDVSTEKSDVTNIYHYVFGELLIETEVFNGTRCEIYQAKLSQIINEIPRQRSELLDFSYVAQLKNDLKEMKIPHLMGSLKIIRSINDENAIKLIDGRHRIQALFELYQDSDRKWDIDLLLEVYYLNDLETCDSEMNHIFVCANARNNLEKTDLMMPEYKISKVIDRMKDVWPGCIEERDLAKMPKISRRRLYNALKDYVLNSQLDESEIYDEILSINQRIGDIRMQELFNTTRPTVTQMKIYQTAKESNFYLNMLCIWDLDTWISELEDR